MSIVLLMRRSIRGFIIPPPPPPRIWTLEDWFVHIPDFLGQNCVQMLHLSKRFIEGFYLFVVNECNRIKQSHLWVSGAAVGWFARMHQTAFTFHFGWIRNFSNMEGIFDGMWGFDISIEIKNDHNNDDVMIMCILLVNITDFFCCELDSRYCGALSNRITECFKLF